jgi:transcriptional regulator of acetoin/glycerol metabolism
VSANDIGDTQPALETNTLIRLASERTSAPRLGLRWVFPTLRETPLRPGLCPVVVGRDGDGEGQLDGSELSRRHAELRLDAGQLVIRDLESRNGIFVNAQRRAQAVLRHHDIVRLGGWVGVVVACGAPGEPVAPPPEAAGGLHLGPTARQVALPARQLAATTISMVLEGPTGTGKERFARAIHDWSGRKGPLVAINCAAVPESLAEAELFGYREGAFTGATRGSAGHFRAANGGTLFLDEVTDMPWTIQAKVLRALEQKEILPVGESQPIAVDVRILSATQTPLEAAVAAKRLRPDFHARLDGFTLRIPPLRERRDDIPSLFLHLLARHGLPAVAAPSGSAVSLSPRLVEALCAYGWPLNVRELDFLAQRLAALHAREPILRRSHLPERIRGFSPAPPAEATPEVSAAGSPTREQLLAALASSGGNLARAAEQLEISRQKAYRILGNESPERLKTARRR